MRDEVYRVNGPRVIFENIDGELILVHMEKGTYYSTDDVGAEIWALIESGHGTAAIGAALAARFDAGPDAIAEAVSGFLRRLLDEELIAPAEAPATPPALEPPPAGPRRPFRAPTLSAYRDMQDMLSLDPIHDVEAAGWPVPRMDGDSALVPDPAP